MKNNAFKKAFYIILPILFWLLIWEIISRIIGNPYFLPGIKDTCKSLFYIISKRTFYSAIASSIFRVISGLAIGSISGVIFAVISYKSVFCKSIIAPMISIIRSTPVATFIIILWVILDGRFLPIFIALMMVMPIIWQNILDGFNSISKELSEVCLVFEFSKTKKLRFLILPSLIKFFIPAVITATGLAWKSEIAAEIIAYTKSSIGQYIQDAKIYYDTPTVFAWTIVIILLSILLEKLTKFLIGRFNI